MLGAAGALCCLAAGVGIGSWMRMRRLLRLYMLQAEADVLGAMRLMLEQERPALPDLLESCAAYAGAGEAAEVVAHRLRYMAQHLRAAPLQGTSGAYASACSQITAAWEHEEERSIMENLFAQLDSGTAAMREQAAASCLRRIRPICQRAEAEAEKGGRLCMQLGLLLGLMAGIALW